MDQVRNYSQVAKGYTQRGLAFLNSDGLIPQLVLTVLIVIAIHMIIGVFESVVEAVRNYNRLEVTLLKDTYTSEQVFFQKTKSTESKLYPSNNELHGIEFTYSFHLFVDPKNIAKASATETGYRNVFYKGANESIWPAMSPGVFVSETNNHMRIYMNAINDVKGSYVDIPNLPIGKWFHVVITQKGKFMDVYVNGNVAVRHEFTSVPRINYGSVFVLSPKLFDPSPGISEDKNNDKFKVTGAMQGMISRLKYFSYALNYSQIDGLYRQGPSSKIVTTSMDHTPPYFHDSWWVTRGY